MSYPHPSKTVTIHISDLSTAIDAVMEKHTEHKRRSQEYQVQADASVVAGEFDSAEQLDTLICGEEGIAESYLNVAMRLKESLEKA